MSLFVVIAAAGSGSRFNNDLPKQFCQIYDRIPIYYVVKTFLSCEFVSGVVCVIQESLESKYREIFSSIEDERLLPPVFGGDTRSASVREGLESIEKYAPSHVLIHDAARCYCDVHVIKNVADALINGSRAAVPCVKPTDAVRLNNICVNRDSVDLVQTPQGFEFKTILALHRKHKDENFPDDAALCDADEIPVDVVEGSHSNKKITFKSDISNPYIFKTGFGFDAHRFAADRPLFLMGVEIVGHMGLAGVSDADVGIHSLVDAILGALCVGDIGAHFPPTDPKYQNANSRDFLRYCASLLNSMNASINNTDTTIVCESPSIFDYVNVMKKAVSESLGVAISRINIKGKTTEGMGFEGRKEGISAYSVVSIRQF